jgi:two-component system cell cycle response regulator DivK
MGGKISALARKRGMLSALDNLVVVIEDDEHLRENLDYLLRQEHIRAKFAADGMTGFALVRRYRPKVVVLDVYVPHLSGFEVVEEIRRDPRLEKILIVAMTGMASDADDLRALKGRADTILAKPIDADHLIDLIRTGMDDGAGAKSRGTRRFLESR